MSDRSDHEAFLRRFHAAHAGVTSGAFARGGTYARLAAQVAPGARVLDLGCGDGYLLGLLGHAHAIGIDLSAAELARAVAAGATVAQARAQALPLRDAAFDVVVSHLAFTLMDDVDAIAAELARVLVPGGRFLAVVGGGPPATATPASDAFACWLELLAAQPCRAPRLGDPRTRTAAGWHAVLAPHGFRDIEFARWVVDLGGDFAAVWMTLSTIYEADGAELAPLRAALAARFAGLRVPCEMVVWLASATRR